MIQPKSSTSSRAAESDAPPVSRVTQLLEEMKADAAQLAQQEAELAKREVTQAAGVVVRDGALMGVGLLFVTAAALVLILAGAAALAAAWDLTGIDPFVSAALGLLSAALLYLLVGAIIAAVGWKHLKKTDLTPKHTLATLAGIAGFSPSPTRGGNS